MAIKTLSPTKLTYPLIKQKERILIWKKVRGMWKDRKPDPLRELDKMRKEWEREYSH